MLDEIASWKRITVDHAVVYCQYFSNKTAKQIEVYVEKNFSGTPEQRSGWIESNYPFQFRDDPTQKWHSLAGKIRQEDNPHVALKVYRDFIDETDSLREGIGLVWDHIQDILSADYSDDDYEYDDHASPISG
jgi:hypothetical protein